MAILKSQAVKQLPVKMVVPLIYQKNILQSIIDAQILMIKALQEDMKILEARITTLEP